MTITKIGVESLPTIDYAAEMVSPLASVAADAGALGVRPCYLHVSLNAYQELVNGRPWEVAVQTETVAEADGIADHYGLPADDGDGSNYTRLGVALVNGREVAVRVYTGRPEDDGAEVAS